MLQFLQPYGTYPIQPGRRLIIVNRSNNTIEDDTTNVGSLQDYVNVMMALRRCLGKIKRLGILFLVISLRTPIIWGGIRADMSWTVVSVLGGGQSRR